MSMPLDPGLDRGGHLLRVGHVALGAVPGGPRGHLRHGRVEVQAHHRGALLQQELRAGAADSRGRSGDQGDLAGEWRPGALSGELGLLQVPVLDVEDVLGGEGAVATQVAGVEDDLDGVPVDVRGDGRVGR